MYLWKYHADAGWLEAHEAALQEAHPGTLAVIGLAGKARALVQVTCAKHAESSRLVRQFGGTAERLARDWQKQFLEPEKRAPLRIGRRLVVVTEPEENLPMQLVIPAAGAFGTGEHATTAMSLRLLEEASRRFSLGWKLLDGGTGTGILALAARRFGAAEVLGLDNDSRAVAHARENARRNKIAGAIFKTADVLRWKPEERYEAITANLFSELLIRALPAFRRALVPGGTLIVSGILREQVADVVRALAAAGFKIIHQRRRGKWSRFLLANAPRPARGKLC